MGMAARQITEDVISVLRQNGARVLDEGKDGAGHQTVTFVVRDQRKTFHYGSSRLNGRSRPNMLARLRRIIREIPEPTVPPAQETEVIEKRVSTSLATRTTQSETKVRLRRDERRELGKRYLALRCHVTVAKEFKITPLRCIELLRSIKGDPAFHVEKELVRLRTAARSEVAGKVITPKTPKTPKPKTPKYNLLPAIPAKRGAYADNFRRNVQMTKALTLDGVPVSVVAEHYGVTPTRVLQIAKENHQYRKWKFD